MSNLFTLNWRDFLKGLLMAVLSPCIAIIYESVNLGVLTFDYNTILKASALGGLAYLAKNFLTDSNGGFLKSRSSFKDDDLGGGQNPPIRDEK